MIMDANQISLFVVFFLLGLFMYMHAHEEDK